MGKSKTIMVKNSVGMKTSVYSILATREVGDKDKRKLTLKKMVTLRMSLIQRMRQLILAIERHRQALGDPQITKHPQR